MHEAEMREREKLQSGDDAEAEDAAEVVAKWRQRLQLPTPFSTSLSLYLLLPIPLLCPHSFSSSSTIMLKRIKMIEVIIFIYLHNSQGGKEGKLQSKHTLD